MNNAQQGTEVANWNRDLAQGKKVEHEICDQINKHSHLIKFSVMDGKVKAFDLFGLVEVKSQEKSQVAFNIESSFRGDPSGITTTKAQVWVICDATNAYYIPVKVLKEHIKTANSKHSYYEYTKSWGYIVYKADLAKLPGVTVLQRNT